MQDFLRYATSLEPTFLGKVEAASAEDIAEYQAISVARIPGVYLSFLRVMGRSTGGLSPFGDAKCDVRELIDCYREERRSVPLNVFDDQRYLIVAADGNYVGFGMLDAADPVDGNVFVGEDLVPRVQIADSFRGLLFQTAFRQFRASRCRYSKLLFDRKSCRSPDEVKALFERCGFQIEAFSDSLNICATASSGIIDFSARTNTFDPRVMVRISSDEIVAVERHAGEMQIELGLEVSINNFPLSS